MKKTKLNNNQIAMNFSFITNKHFYNYISGNNKSIIDALSSFSSSNKTNIIFLRGNKSSGKSHLCRAIMNTSKKNILYLASDDIKTVNVFEYDLLIINRDLRTACRYCLVFLLSLFLENYSFRIG